MYVVLLVEYMYVLYLSIDWSNKPRNCLRDILDTLRIDPLAAIGRYSSCAVFIFNSVSAATSSLSLTSTDIALVIFTTSICSLNCFTQHFISWLQHRRLKGPEYDKNPVANNPDYLTTRKHTKNNLQKVMRYAIYTILN